MSDIEISIVVPTYNRPDTLKYTLESLCNQTYPIHKYEIIISDDSTTSEIQELVTSFSHSKKNNIRYLKANSTTKGPANARNVGIHESLGIIIGFTDDDCIVAEDWIESAKKCFDMDDGISGLYGAVETVGDCKKNIFRIARRVCVQNDDGSYVTPNVFYKKDVLLQVGCFDVTQRYLEDIELGWRVEKVGTILFCPSVKVKHQMLCLTLKEYLYRLRVIEYWVMMYSKHPEHVQQDNFAFSRMMTIRPLYVAFSLMALSSIMVSSYLTYSFIVLAVIFYSLHNVFTDWKVTSYIKRYLKYPIAFIVDMIRCYYSLKGSVKYKFFLLY